MPAQCTQDRAAQERRAPYPRAATLHTSACVSIRLHTSPMLTYAQERRASTCIHAPRPCWVAARAGSRCVDMALFFVVALLRQHTYTSAYVSIRQHTSAYIYKPAHASEVMWWHSFPANMSLYFADKAALTASNFSGETSETTHLYTTSAYVSIRQHTSAYVSIRQHTSAYDRRTRSIRMLYADVC